MHKNNAFVVVSWLPFICQSETGCKSSKIGFDDMVVELQDNCGGKESTYSFLCQISRLETSSQHSLFCITVERRPSCKCEETAQSLQ
jgi:hypothetical protein